MYGFTNFKLMNFYFCLFNALSTDAACDSTSTLDYAGISTQCKNFYEVIDWFNNTQIKNNVFFPKFDIVNCNPVMIFSKKPSRLQNTQKSLQMKRK